jgi:3-hydroxyisobutyrate dehydrogenase-like beta-hydroxyacid dehydrogenase
MSENIGFIGLGTMGAPIARRLMAAGYQLVVADTRSEVLEEFERLGARPAATPAAVADGAETVFASLPTPVIVEQVATGEDGVIHGHRARRFIDLSTTGTSTAARIFAKLRAKQIVQLDAPVSGGKAGAERGTLAVMVSGPRNHFEAAEPLLRQIGKPFFIGESPGLGQTMKLVNNLLTATALAATSEAMVMAVKAGIDAATAIDVINAGSGRSGVSQDKFPRAILPRTFDYGFATGLMYKDLKLCLSEAEDLGTQMWVGNAVKQLWQLIHNQAGPQSDFTRIVEIPEQWAGVKVGGPATVEASR